jgi:hypothetical protein
VPQEAHLRCRLQEPHGGLTGAFQQRRLTKRSREWVNHDVRWMGPASGADPVITFDAEERSGALARGGYRRYLWAKGRSVSHTRFFGCPPIYPAPEASAAHRA